MARRSPPPPRACRPPNPPTRPRRRPAHPALAAALLALGFCGLRTSADSAPASGQPFRPLARTALPRVRDLPGVCRVFEETTRLPRRALPTPLNGDFSLEAWIRPDALPSSGSGGFSEKGPVTIVQLGGNPVAARGFQPSATFRIRRHFLEFVWWSPTGWKDAFGHSWLPPGRWFHVAAVRRGDTFEIFLDGESQGRAAGARSAGTFSWCTVGRSGNKRRFLGRMADLRIESRAVSAATLRRRVQALPGYVPLRTPQVDSRWLRAGLLFSQPAGFPYYPAARVAPGTLHPLDEGCGIQFTPIPRPQQGPGPDLLIGADPTLFGSRLALYQPQSRDPGSDWSQKGWPVYDPGRTLELGEQTAGLDGRRFVFWRKSPAGPEFLGQRRGRIFLWQNRGRPNAPRYAIAGPVLFAGKPLPQAMPAQVHLYEWRSGDVDGDGVPDMLLTTWWGDPRNDWPYRERRLGAKNPHVGPGRGYDIAGRWLGADRNALLYWARGRAGPNAPIPAFGPVRPVFYGRRPADRPVQWRVPHGIVSPALLEIQKQRWILLFGNVNRILALPVRIDSAGEARCGRAVNLLENDAPLKFTYFQNQMAAADIDGDGRQEVLVGGNPGRIVVLCGDRPGTFREAGCLSVRGGWVETDTLSVPCYLDWDGDGRPDLLVGDASGWLSFWPGTDRPALFGSPRWLRAGGRTIHHQAGYSGSLQGPGEAGWGYLQPTVADWDMDGDPDVIANDITGRIVFYERRGSPWNLKPARLFRFRGRPLPAAWRSRPAVLPADMRFHGFARPCLVYLDDHSILSVAVPERTGAVDIARITPLTGRDGTPIRLSGWGIVSGRTKLCVADWDGDGDWDLLFGTNFACHSAFLEDPPPCATPLWLENIGSNARPRFASPRVIRRKNGRFINLRVHDCSPWVADFDHDGRPDLITGAEDGKVYFFRRRDLR